MWHAKFCNKIWKFFLDGFYFMQQYMHYKITKEQRLHFKLFLFSWLTNLEQIFMYLTKKLFAQNDECLQQIKAFLFIVSFCSKSFYCEKRKPEE